MKYLVWLQILIYSLAINIFIQPKTNRNKLKPSKAQTQEIVNYNSSAIVEPLFSPNGNLTKRLLYELAKAKNRLWIAVYLITDKRIASVIIQTKQANPSLDLVIIVDPFSATSIAGKAKLLHDSGAKVMVFAPNLTTKNLTSSTPVPGKNYWSQQAIMHNKYAIIDGNVWTGSFNFTVAADRKNWENAIIIRETSVTEQYIFNFLDLQGQCLTYTQYVNYLEQNKINQPVTTPTKTPPAYPTIIPQPIMQQALTWWNQTNQTIRHWWQKWNEPNYAGQA